ncbi:uncharacterized protein LOC143227578 [Tachypleus tridentatus]|uniref:uncharacterized protein LOC143227578 n=1 Tax=Tachypleus tridentatus TaxID=6853 RepID=UPI003FD19F52
MVLPPHITDNGILFHYGLASLHYREWNIVPIWSCLLTLQRMEYYSIMVLPPHITENGILFQCGLASSHYREWNIVPQLLDDVKCKQEDLGELERRCSELSRSFLVCPQAQGALKKKLQETKDNIQQIIATLSQHLQDISEEHSKWDILKEKEGEVNSSDVCQVIQETQHHIKQMPMYKISLLILQDSLLKDFDTSSTLVQEVSALLNRWQGLCSQLLYFLHRLQKMQFKTQNFPQKSQHILNLLHKIQMQLSLETPSHHKVALEFLVQLQVLELEALENKQFMESLIEEGTALTDNIPEESVQSCVITQLQEQWVFVTSLLSKRIDVLTIVTKRWQLYQHQLCELQKITKEVEQKIWKKIQSV